MSSLTMMNSASSMQAIGKSSIRVAGDVSSREASIATAITASELVVSHGRPLPCHCFTDSALG